tara:strand:- start:192 stop:377 length:186 start_codon:yes stop_codon:yes gene_type:complete
MKVEEIKYKDHTIVLRHYGDNPHLPKEYLIYTPEGRLNFKTTITELVDAKAQIDGLYDDYQ